MSNTALLIVDMVYDFTDPDGLVFYEENLEVLSKINGLTNICRNKSALVIYIEHSYRKDKKDGNLEKMRKCCISGSGGDITDRMLQIKPEDYVIKKRRYSAFFSTDLDLVLRENEIKNVVIVGTKTNCCIRATVTDAYYLNYNVFVVRECVATNDKNINEVHLSDIEKYFGSVIDMREIYKAFL